MKLWNAFLSVALAGAFFVAQADARTSEHALLVKDYAICKTLLKASPAQQKKIAKPGHLKTALSLCRTLIKLGVAGVERRERNSSSGYESSGGGSSQEDVDPNADTPYSNGTHIGPNGVTSCSGGTCIGPSGVTSCSGGTCIGPSGVTSCSGGTCIGPSGVTSCSGGTCIGPDGVSSN